MTPEPAWKSLWKSDPYAKQRALRKEAKRLARAACREAVFRRAGWRGDPPMRGSCERCGRRVFDDKPEWHTQRAQVNEIKPRSLGGDSNDPNNCELICQKCHFGGPSGAHAPTKERMKPQEDGL